MSQIFEKRIGTTDLGKLYEDLNVASLVLKMVKDDHIDNFALSSNDETFGSFDDIVCEIESEDSVKKYAIQLKHTNDRRKTLTTASLIHDNGDFSIQKYFQTFKKIFKPDNSHNFILFTNRNLDSKNNPELIFENQGFSVKMTKAVINPIINTNRNRGCCYKFVNIRNTLGHVLSTEQQEYKLFFEYFFLYTNQASCREIEESVKQQIQKDFWCGDAEFNNYKQFISRWSIREGKKEKLNKAQMKRVIVLCVLSSFIKPLSFTEVNSKTKCLRAAISEFDVTLLKRKSYTFVSILWGDFKNILANKLVEVNRIRTEYQLNCDYVKDIKDINDKICTKLLWLIGVCPLIVTGNRSTYEVVQLCHGNKFIILLEHGSGEIDLQNITIFKNLSDLDPESEVYKNITTVFEYSLQEKKEQALKTLITNEDDGKFLATDDLAEMLEEKCIVGGQKETLPSPYINRYLTRNIVNFEYLEKIDKTTVIVIDSTDQNLEVKNRMQMFNLIEVDDYLSTSATSDSSIHVADLTFGSNIFVMGERCSKEDFRKICEKNKSAERYHHFSVTDDGKLEWTESLSDIDELQPFCKEDGSTKETQLRYQENTISLIIGDPGMGKSVLMKNLKNNYSSRYISIFFYTEDVISLFKFFSGQYQTIDLDKFEDFILSIKYSHSQNFEKKAIKMLMRKNYVLYIWDAIDEISSENVEIIIDVILQLSKKNLPQWVTSRCHLKRNLEKKFNLFSKKIIQFSEEQQTDYIHERLTKNKRLKQNINSEVKKIKQLIVRGDILGIPLQIFMLTELFLQNPYEYLNLSKDTFNVTDLYQYFVDEKFNIYFQEKTKAEIYQERLVQDHKSNTFINYQKAAVKALVPSVLQEECKDFLENIRQKNDPIGIIIEVTDDTIPHFIHNSFAEYFVAIYFIKHYKSIPNFNDIIFEDTQRNVRFFFDLLLAKGSPAHVAILYKNIDTLQKYGDNLRHWKDLGKRNVLHLACSWGQEYPIFKVTNKNNIYILDIPNEENYTVLEEDPKYVDILQYLLKVCDVSEHDELFNYTSLKYAERTKSLFAKAVILLKQKKKYENLRDDYSMTSILYYSAKFSYIDIIDLYQNFPYIMVQNNGATYLHLSVCNANFLLELLKISKYERAINIKDKFGQTAVSKACQHGQEAAVKFLTQCDASINIASNNGRTPLHYACQFGHDKIVQRLIKFGTNIDVLDKKQWTPLHVACYNGHSEVTRLLLEEDADTNMADGEGWTPLHSACIKGHKNIVKLLIESGTNVNIFRDSGWTPLHSACSFGHEETVALLLKSGAEVNARTKNDGTPLQYACEKGYEKIVKLLCDHNANVNLPNNKKWTPLHLASNNGHVGIVKLLITAGSKINMCSTTGWTAMHVAACKDHHQVVQILIENNADFDAQAENGRTPLHYACQLGHIETVKLLIKHNSNIHAKDEKDLTPLHWSCIKRQAASVKILLETKAISVNAPAYNGKTPMHYACQLGHYEIVKILLDFNKTTVNVADTEGVTPLHFACHNGHEAIVRLIKPFIDINITNKKGWTPIHHACQSGHVKIVNLLIQCGAKVNVTTELGWTSLHLASQNGHDETVRLLMEAGAQINASTNLGRTPLHTACEADHFKVVWVLIYLEAEIDKPDKEGWTPLHIACNQESINLIQYLITSGANVNAAAKNGWTPFHLTCARGNKKICQYLLKYSDVININAIDHEKRTPIYLATQFEQTATVNLLITHGANIYINAEGGLTTLHAACLNGNYQLLQLLISCMENINVTDANQRTPLHYACEQGHDSIVELLINSGANINAGDTSNYTPLHLACMNGYDRIVQILLKHKASTNIQDCQDKTTLHVACEKGYIKIVEMLLTAGANAKVSTDVGLTPFYLAKANHHDEIIELLKKRSRKKLSCRTMW